MEGKKEMKQKLIKKGTIFLLVNNSSINILKCGQNNIYIILEDIPRISSIDRSKYKMMHSQNPKCGTCFKNWHEYCTFFEDKLAALFDGVDYHPETTLSQLNFP